MEFEHRPLSAAELDAMSPDERSAAFEQRVVTDLETLPEAFRDRIVTTAERLGKERRAAHDS